MEKNILFNQILIMEALLTLITDAKAKKELKEQIQFTKAYLRAVV